MKYLMFSDIHWGKTNNSQLKNQDCLDFIEFVCNYTENNPIDQIIFLGDWFDNRDSINVQTLYYSSKGLEKLNSISKKTPIKFIVGNHDLFLKNSRDITSLLVAKEFTNIQVISEPTMIGEDLYCPWLVGDEKLPLLIKQYNPRYVFGHFELPSFKFNQFVTYEGIFNAEDYKSDKLKKIFSGHFHTANGHDGIYYIGSTHSLDMSDVDDESNKGITILDTDTSETIQVPWDNAPIYRKINISQLLDREDEYLSGLHKIYLNIVLDINFNDKKEEYREQLKEKYDIRNISYQAQWFEDATQEVEDVEVKDFSNVETLVVQYIKQIETESVRVDRLIELFNSI